MTADFSLLLTVMILVVGAGLVVLTGRGNLVADDSLRRQVTDLADKVMILERMNRALQEALAVAQTELSDTRQLLQAERDHTRDLENQIGLIQNELIIYRARSGGHL